MPSPGLGELDLKKSKNEFIHKSKRIYISIVRQKEKRIHNQKNQINCMTPKASTAMLSS
jgi:hypothetical protein